MLVIDLMRKRAFRDELHTIDGTYMLCGKADSDRPKDQAATPPALVLPLPLPPHSVQSHTVPINPPPPSSSQNQLNFPSLSNTVLSKTCFLPVFNSPSIQLSIAHSTTLFPPDTVRYDTYGPSFPNVYLISQHASDSILTSKRKPTAELSFVGLHPSKMSSPFCGCYYYNYNHHVPAYMPRPKQYLPLLETKVRTLIIATASRTVLKQTFTNPSTQDAIKECVYAFPLYDGVSVVSFTGRVGKKLLTGLVKEKVKAKQIFDQAVSRGQTAGLLEQSQESADVFTTKLGNIPAGQSVVVEITYIGELKHHETEGLRFTIPTNIAPRYGPATYDASNADVHDSSGISITVDICMEEGSFIKRLESPSHPIAVSMGVTSTSDADPMMSKASATLSLGSSVLYKDFVLIVQCKDIGIPKALLETHPTIPHQRALMATLVPKFALPPSRPEIVFVADRSGSMQGNIPMLISAMNVFLKSMPAGVKFNICSFGSRHDFLWSQSHSYTKESLAIATQHVAGFSANYGGTETFSAIRGTIERRYKDIPLELILLTDGDITSQTELFAYLNEQVQQSKGSIRVFPLGIGDGVSHSLIEGVARAGNGFAQAVQIGERFENSVVRMLRGALTPHITDYKIEVKYEAGGDRSEDIDNVTDGMRVLMSKEETSQKSLVSAKPTPKATISLFDTTVDPEKEDIKGSNKSQFWLPTIPTPKFHQAPHRIPSLFAFSRTTVYLLLSPSTIQRKPVAVILRGTSAHGPLELEIPVEALPLPGETIHQLAAKKAVQDLEEGRGWLYDAKDQNGTLVKNRYPSCFQELVEKEAVRLGEKFQIAGKWCSFVAVAANDKEIAARQNKEKDGNEMTSNQGKIIEPFLLCTFANLGTQMEMSWIMMKILRVRPPKCMRMVSWSSTIGLQRRRQSQILMVAVLITGKHHIRQRQVCLRFKCKNNNYTSNISNLTTLLEWAATIMTLEPMQVVCLVSLHL